MRRILTIAALLVAATATTAYADTAALHSQGDDPRAVNADYDTAAGTVTIAGTVLDRSLSVTITPAGTPPVTIGYNPGVPLALGTHAANGAALELTGLAGACPSPTATVTLKAVASTLAHAATVLRLSFDQACQGATAPLHGEVDIDQPLAAELVSANSDMAIGEGSSYAYSVYRDGALPYIMLVRNGRPTRLTSSRDEAYMGGMDAGRIVYQLAAHRHGRRVNSNIYLRSVAALKPIRLPHLNTAAWEWNPDISGRHLIFQRGEDTSKRWDILLYDLKTHKTKLVTHGTKRHYTDATAVAGDYIVWYSCAKAGTCTVTRYQISTGHRSTLAGTSLYYYDPAVTADGTVYAIRSLKGCGASATIVRWSPGAAVEDVLALPQGIDAGYTDTDQIAGTTYLYYGGLTCSTNQWTSYRLPVRMPAK
jgi:hypothetical protein